MIRQLHPDSLACPTCLRPWPLDSVTSKPLTGRELDALSAWWHYRSVKTAAKLIGVSEQRAKNLLASGRAKAGVHTNAELVSLNIEALRSKEELVMQHNVPRGEAR